MFYQNFPFSNAHQLNLDWILMTLKRFPLTVNQTSPDENGNINLPTVAGMSSWNGIGADGAGNVDPIESLVDWDAPDPGFHVYSDGTYLMLAWNNDDDVMAELVFPGPTGGIAFRTAESGTWNDWTWIDNMCQDMSSDITLGLPSCIDQFQPYNTKAWVQGGRASVYIEGKTSAAAGANDHIAGGLPVPLTVEDGYVIGMILDSQTSALKPCRFLIDGNGDLTFSYLGNAAQAGDVLVIRAEYPVTPSL